LKVEVLQVRLTVGTFNLNNLFSRWNFRGEIKAIKEGETGVDATVTYSFTDPAIYRIRTYDGKLVKAKTEKDRQRIVERIKRIDLDVLAVQEVEDIDTLRGFAQNELAGMYRYQVLVEGNDPRFIDLGVLSKLPIGAITSWRYAVHADDPSKPVFGRDLLEVEILNQSRKQKLFTVYNNHLKSHYVPWYEDPVEGAKKANARRSRQAETTASIVEARMRPDSSFIVLGDMNDPPDSEQLVGLIRAPGLGLVDALTAPKETRPPKHDDPPPGTAAWTHRYKESGQPAQYELYDQIWLSPALAVKQQEAWIDRRKRHTGDGSDHDPAWVVLEL
jgi:endonuclease/exonuclease/phosphatase family metal-dependent hydrolase